MKRKCSIAGCEKSHAARGFCIKHYHNWARLGTPITKTVKPRHLSSEAWFWLNTKQNGACLESTLKPNNVGRPSIYVKRKTWIASRYAWTIERGEIPKGLNVCHACDNPACVLIEHLWLGTQSQNIKDSVAKGRWR